MDVYIFANNTLDGKLAAGCAASAFRKESTIRFTRDFDLANAIRMNANSRNSKVYILDYNLRGKDLRRVSLAIKERPTLDFILYSRHSETCQGLDANIEPDVSVTEVLYTDMGRTDELTIAAASKIVSATDSEFVEYAEDSLRASELGEVLVNLKLAQARHGHDHKFWFSVINHIREGGRLSEHFELSAKAESSLRVFNRISKNNSGTQTSSFTAQESLIGDASRYGSLLAESLSEDHSVPISVVTLSNRFIMYSPHLIKLYPYSVEGIANVNVDGSTVSFTLDNKSIEEVIAAFEKRLKPIVRSQ